MTDWTENLEKLRLLISKRSGIEATRDEIYEVTENFRGFIELLDELDRKYSMKEGNTNI